MAANSSLSIQQKTKTLLKKGCPEQAMEFLEKHIPTFPDEPWLYVYYAAACQKAGPPFTHRIPSFLYQALRLNPEMPVIWWALCRYLKTQKIRDYPSIQTCYIALISLEEQPCRRAGFVHHAMMLFEKDPKFNILEVLTKVAPDPDSKLNDCILRYIAAYTWKTCCIPKEYAKKVLFSYKHLIKSHAVQTRKKYMRVMCNVMTITQNWEMLQAFIYDFARFCNEVSLKSVAFTIFKCLFKLLVVQGRTVVKSLLTLYMNLPNYVSSLPTSIGKIMEASYHFVIRDEITTLKILKDIEMNPNIKPYADKLSLLCSMELNDWKTVWRAVSPFIIKKCLMVSYFTEGQSAKYLKLYIHKFGLFEISLTRLLCNSSSKSLVPLASHLGHKAISLYTGPSPMLCHTLMESLSEVKDLIHSVNYRQLMVKKGYILITLLELIYCSKRTLIEKYLGHAVNSRMYFKLMQFYYSKRKMKEVLQLAFKMARLKRPYVAVLQTMGQISFLEKNYSLSYYFFSRAYLVDPNSWFNVKAMADIMVYNNDVNGAKWFLTSYRDQYRKNKSICLRSSHYSVILGHYYPEGENDRGLGVKNAYYLSNYSGSNLFTLHLLGDEYLKIGMFKAGYRCFVKAAISGLKTYALVKGAMCLFSLKKMKCCLKKVLDLERTESDIHVWGFISYMFLKLATAKIAKRNYSVAQQFLQISVLYSTRCLLWDPSYVTFWKYLGNALYNLSVLPVHNGFLYVPSVLLYEDQPDVYLRLNQFSALKLALRSFYMGVKWSVHSVSSLFWTDIGVTFLRISDMLPNHLKTPYTHLAYQSLWIAIKVDPLQWRSWNALGISAVRKEIAQPTISYSAFELAEYLQFTSFGTTSMFNKGVLQFEHHLVKDAAATFHSLYVSNHAKECSWIGKILIQEHLEPVNISKLLEFFIAFIKQRPGENIVEMLTFYNKSLFSGKTVRRMYKVLRISSVDTYRDNGGYRNALLRYCRKKKKSALLNMVVYLSKSESIPIEACELFADLLFVKRPEKALKYYLAALCSSSVSNKLAYISWKENNSKQCAYLLSNIYNKSPEYVLEYPGVLCNLLNWLNQVCSDLQIQNVIAESIFSDFNHDPSVLAMSAYIVWQTKDVMLLRDMLDHYQVPESLFQECEDLLFTLSEGEIISLLKELVAKEETPLLDHVLYILNTGSKINKMT